MAEHIHGGVVIEIRAATGSERHVVSETTIQAVLRPARPPACRACSVLP